jgi:hypothetical protein
MGSFDHLKKDLTKLTRWPGKRVGETYAQTKARQKETPSLEAALRQAPMSHWGLTQEAALEAFFPREAQAAPDTMYATYAQRLGRFIRDGFVDPAAATELLIARGGAVGLMTAIRAVAVGTAPGDAVRKAAEEVVRAARVGSKPLRADRCLAVKAVRVAFPGLVSDEDVMSFAGRYVDCLASSRSCPAGHSWEEVEAALALLRTLPNWRALKAVAEVHES